MRRRIDMLRAGALREESGMILVLAVILTIMMLSLSLALLATTDKQTSLSGKERVQESTLTLTEGALNAQANLLGSNWPTGAANAYPACTNASTGNAKCPNPAALLGGFSRKDFGVNGAASSWSISVRDNALGNYYDDAATATQPAYDASGPSAVPDGMVWLRVQAVVRGNKRTVVALIKAFSLGRTFPRGVITAGKFETTNSGKKTIVDTGNGAGINVRCSGAASPTGTCLKYDVGKGQVWPNIVKADPAIPNAMTSQEVDSMRTQAQALGTHFTSCPSSLPSARVVFIETGGCSYSGNTNVNSQANPGMLIINSGGISFGGTTNFYGIVYAVNSGGSSAMNLVSLGGNSQVMGAVVVDGAGGVSAGSSKMNIVYDPNVFNVVSSLGSAQVIANTWRELNGR
jgi:hypothetical protein